jgi:hypothetical protein
MLTHGSLPEMKTYMKARDSDAAGNLLLVATMLQQRIQITKTN